MRCLILVPSLKRAGAETQAVDLANGLASRGRHVVVCTFESQLDQRDRLDSRVRFYHVPRRSKYDLSLPLRVAKIIDDERIEVIHAVLQFTALVAWLACRKAKVRPPVIAGIHTTANLAVKEEILDRLLYRMLLRRISGVVFVCEAQRQYWVRRFPELKANCAVVYNGVDAEEYLPSRYECAGLALRNALGITATAFVFGCIAAFRPEKGHHLLIEAFSRLPPNCHLVLAGDGASRTSVERAVAEKGLTRRVHFVGTVPDVRPTIAACNATVLASTAVETFSMAMLESMALGVPLVATRVGGLEEAIEDRESGLLCEPGDVDSLSTALAEMSRNAAASQVMGRNAERTVRERFTRANMILGHESLLDRAING